MWRAGLSNDISNMPSISGLCIKPTPRVNLPFVSREVVRA